MVRLDWSLDGGGLFDLDGGSRLDGISLDGSLFGGSLSDGGGLFVAATWWSLRDDSQIAASSIALSSMPVSLIAAS